MKLPKTLADQLNITPHSVIEVHIEDNKLILEPIAKVEQSELVLEEKLLVLRTKNPQPK